METLPCTRVVSSRYHVESCNFSPDGKLLAACFGDFTVRLLRIGEQKIVDKNLRDDHAHPNTDNIHIDLYWVIKEHKNSVWCARFSPDGLLLCTCSSDKTANIWNVNSQTLERSFDMHTDTVWSCCFAPANNSSTTESLIATGSSDQTVKVWNVESGEVVHDLGGYGDAVDCLDFSSTGEILCTSCRNGVVKIWINLLFARTEKECINTDGSLSLEPIYLDLVAVNRSASRFCRFSTYFSFYIQDSKSTDNDTAIKDVALSSGPENDAIRDEDTLQKDEVLSESDATMNLFPKSDPHELLFAGGPENSFAVWSLRDLAAAFKNLLTEDSDTESTQDINKEISSNTDDQDEYPKHLSQCEERKEDGVDDHCYMIDDRELKDSDSKTSVDYDQMGPETQLRTITEEEETQSDLTERMEHEDSSSQITDMSQENSTVYGEPSYFSDEPFSFYYKVEPRWTLTEHLSIVWDCCTATLLSSHHDVTSGVEVANEAQVLISCSGDRTLRYH